MVVVLLSCTVAGNIQWILRIKLDVPEGPSVSDESVGERRAASESGHLTEFVSLRDDWRFESARGLVLLSKLLL